MASEEMSFENVDGQWMPAYTINSPLMKWTNITKIAWLYRTPKFLKFVQILSQLSPIVNVFTIPVVFIRINIVEPIISQGSGNQVFN